MESFILTAIKEGGPLFGPLLFAVAFGMSWMYHGLLRQVAIRQNRFALLLIEKDFATLRECLDYGILDVSSGALDDMARLKGA